LRRAACEHGDRSESPKGRSERLLHSVQASNRASRIRPGRRASQSFVLTDAGRRRLQWCQMSLRPEPATWRKNCV
jgi:hypothetical protein